MYEFTAPFQSPAGSPIRELFKYLSEPGMISFAGGYPATDLFDIDGLRVAQRLAYETPVQCLQYGPTDGLPMLKKELISLMARRGVNCAESELMVTTGSQQGLDVLLRVLVAPGDVVLTEQPAYPATLQAFRLQQARLVTIPVDSDGLDVGRLAELLASGQIGRPKLLYTVPTFANPTGATLSAARRKALLLLAVKYRFLIVEDDPYADLRFSGEPVPSILAMSADVQDWRDWVVHFASLSKVVSPGLRIGWVVGPSEIVRRCVIAKQTADLCTAPWTQATAAVYLASGGLERHLPVITEAYRLKCHVLCATLRERLGDGIEFHSPQGGMFVWGRVAGVDVGELLTRSIKEKVLFVPGNAFFADNVDSTSLRFSFAAPGVDAISEGVTRFQRAYETARS